MQESERERNQKKELDNSDRKESQINIYNDIYNDKKSQV